MTNAYHNKIHYHKTIAINYKNKKIKTNENNNNNNNDDRTGNIIKTIRNGFCAR